MPLPADPDPALQSYAHPERLVTADWLSATSAGRAWPSSSPTRTCCSTTPATSPARSRSTGTPTSTTRTCATTSTASSSPTLMDRKGISRDDTVVIYGDKSNWWAAYALWVFTLFGHPDVRLLDGGRDLWISDGRDTTLDVPNKHDHRLPRRRARRRTDPRVQGRRARHPRDAAADRRPLAAGVHRRAHPHARLPRGGRTARRPHPDRAARSRGPRRPTTAAGSAAAPNSRSCTASSPPTTRRSSTAASVSARATPGSC